MQSKLFVCLSFKKFFVKTCRWQNPLKMRTTMLEIILEKSFIERVWNKPLWGLRKAGPDLSFEEIFSIA